MKNQLLKLVNGLNDTILTIVFVSIVIFSVIVAESIQLKPLEAQSVLGINNTDGFFTSVVNNPSNIYSVNTTEDSYQLSFKFTLNLNGESDISIPLGKINANAIKQGTIYRSTLNIPDIYKNDIDVLLLVDGKPFGLLLNGIFYQNDFNSIEENNSEIALKVISKKTIYYKIPGTFVIYK